MLHYTRVLIFAHLYSSKGYNNDNYDYKDENNDDNGDIVDDNNDANAGFVNKIKKKKNLKFVAKLLGQSV